MAKFMVEADSLGEQLEGLDRDMIRRVVMAGAEAVKKEMQAVISEYHHVRTGSMMQGVGPGKYKENLGSGSVEVYPQGDDGRGVSNALKAFVINSRKTKKKPARSGDKFLTKASSKKRFEAVAVEAMKAESERILAEMTK